ncbi:hypothetical protein R5R35_000214 [Gryllus longicercus]|uniref:Thiamine transporter 2 n=1 Tax=Gryllus longicercus TaxID=2509291 RepID=A0AAN9WPI1_9ORTH
MEVWLKTTLLLCIFGFLKEFRPSEPFVTPYLTTYKNFTEEQVNQEIYPVATYSYLCLLVLVFLVTDLLRYKPMIILLAVSGVITFCLLAFGNDIPAMKAVEVFYGMYMAAEVAYFTYMYAKVDKEHYQRVTGHTRTAFLLGRFMSGIVSQTLVSTDTITIHQLNFITIASQAVASLWAFLLPSVQHSMYFHRHDSVTSLTPSEGNHLPQGMDNVGVESNSAPVLDSNTEAPYTISRSPEHKRNKIGMMGRCFTAYTFLWRDCRQAYTNVYVVKWSIWWAVATCGFLQGFTYIQVLWEAIVADGAIEGDVQADRYNGAIEATYTIIGAAASFACGWLTLNWSLVGEMVLALCSVLQGTALLVSAFSSSLWLAYGMYVVFGMLYHPMITIANSEVAKHINEDSYALIFGINTFLALLLQTILTVVVVSDVGFALSSRDQFKVYGGCYLVLAAFFLILALFTLGKHFLRKSRADNEDPKALV